MAGFNAGVRIAEVLQGLARTGRVSGQLSRESQALRGLEFDEEAQATQALRGFQDRISRPSVREAFDRLRRTGRLGELSEGMNANTIEDFIGRARLSQQNNPVKDWLEDEFLTDNNKKKRRLLKRADDFNAHFNSKQSQQVPLYREVVNVENKNSIDDVKGLQTAYNKDTGLFTLDNTLYVSGTGGKSGFTHKVGDFLTDIFQIPTHTVNHSEKYRDVMAELNKNPNITRLVGHSLGASVIQEINNRNNQKYITTTYNAPFMAFGDRGGKNPHHLRFRNKGDPISSLDRDAIQVETGNWQPLENHKFQNMKTQGTYEFGVDDGVEVRNQI